MAATFRTSWVYFTRIAWRMILILWATLFRAWVNFTVITAFVVFM
jgi:hypothetical protein